MLFWKVGADGIRLESHVLPHGQTELDFMGPLKVVGKREAGRPDSYLRIWMGPWVSGSSVPRLIRI